MIRWWCVLWREQAAQKIARGGRLHYRQGEDLAHGTVVVRARPFCPPGLLGGNCPELFAPTIQASPGPATENQLGSLLHGPPGLGWQQLGGLARVRKTGAQPDRVLAVGDEPRFPPRSNT